MNILNVINAPWAITPEKMSEICGIYAAHLLGEKIDIEAIEARLGKPLNNQASPYQIVDGVAVIEIDGVIAKRMNMFSQISGGTSSELIQSQLAAALNDPRAHSILFVIDSPGGAVDGTQQAADAIRSVRGVKPMYALADGVMASAAYWIGSAADKVFSASDTTAVGSIGIVAQHKDYSKAQEMCGVKVTDIVAGKYKAVGSPNVPLSDESKSSIQAQLDHAYGVFVDAVAKNRGVDTKTVLDKMADGRIFFGKQAIDAGLVDGMSSMSALIAQLNGRKSSSDAIAAAQVLPTQAQEPSVGQDVAVDPVKLAAQITDYVAQQAAKGNRISCAEAAAYIESQQTKHLPITRTIPTPTVTTDAAQRRPENYYDMARKISAHVRKQADLGSRVSCVEAAAHIEAQSDPSNPITMAGKIRDYVAQQAALGIRVSVAEAAAQLESQSRL